MAADALAACVASTSAPMILTMTLSYMKQDFNYQCQIIVKEWYELGIHRLFYVSYEKFNMQSLKKTETASMM